MYEELWRQEPQLTKWLRLTKGHNSGKNSQAWPRYNMILLGHGNYKSCQKTTEDNGARIMGAYLCIGYKV